MEQETEERLAAMREMAGLDLPVAHQRTWNENRLLKLNCRRDLVDAGSTEWRKGRGR